MCGVLQTTAIVPDLQKPTMVKPANDKSTGEDDSSKSKDESKAASIKQPVKAKRSGGKSAEHMASAPKAKRKTRKQDTEAAQGGEEEAQEDKRPARSRKAANGASKPAQPDIAPVSTDGRFARFECQAEQARKPDHAAASVSEIDSGKEEDISHEEGLSRQTRARGKRTSAHVRPQSHSEVRHLASYSAAP